MSQWKKKLYTLNINNFCPKITAITFPYLQKYAKKINAEFIVLDKIDPSINIDGVAISQKFQMYKLAQEPNTISIFMDADTLVNPNCIDYSECITRGTAFSFGRDFSYVRFNPSVFAEHGDNRCIGFCTWFVICDTETYKLWEPPANPAEAIKNITPTSFEDHLKSPASLLDDYQLSVNCAKYKLKYTHGAEVHAMAKYNPADLWHQYLITPEQKVEQMKFMIKHVWKLNRTKEEVLLEEQLKFEELKRKIIKENSRKWRAIPHRISNCVKQMLNRVLK